jgi:hypothetical protein
VANRRTARCCGQFDDLRDPRRRSRSPRVCPPARGMRNREPRQPRSRRRPAAAASTPWEEFAREFARSRRYEHPFALVVLPLPSVVSAMSAEFLAHERGQSGPRIRSIDKVWLVGRSLYLLLPETDRRGALTLIARLERESSGLVSGMAASAVSFPEDGLTPFALIASLPNARTLSELGPLLPQPSTNGAQRAHDGSTGVDGAVPRGGVRGALDRVLLRRTRPPQDRDRDSAVN